jgi:Bacterial alpha-L-rhamnosidase 6 hairpin glycosidase domain
LDNISLPRFIRGDWIWKKSLLKSQDCFLFARKKVLLEVGDGRAEFWVTAHCAYQLFFNGRLIGFGPSPARREKVYVDYYDLSYYIQTGTNVIALLIYHTAPDDGASDIDQLPGFWCQMNYKDRPLFWSDREWQVYDGRCFDLPRCRTAPALDLNEAVAYRYYPDSWIQPEFSDTSWPHADYSIALKDTGMKLVPSPFSSNYCEEIDNIKPMFKGQLAHNLNHTHVVYDKIFTKDGIYAAKTFFFSEEEDEIEVKFACDDFFKFYCNNHLITAILPGGKASGKPNNINSKTHKVAVKKGWNSFLIIQECHAYSMGFMLQYVDTGGKIIVLHQDTVQDSVSNWSIVGPLKLPLNEATPSLKFEWLKIGSFPPMPPNIIDVDTFLDSHLTQKVSDLEEDHFVLAQGEYAVLELDILKYGFPFIECWGSEGDILDVHIGISYDPELGRPVSRSGRGFHTLHLEGDSCEWLKFSPVEAKFITLVARNAKFGIKIRRVSFFNYYRPQRNETSFTCSDEELNRLWQIGCNIQRTTARRVMMDTPGSKQQTYLIDAFLQCVCAASVFGDYDLSEKTLRAFADSQYENGDIPALSQGHDNISQVDHLFLFPGWLIWHYKSTGDKSLLHDMLPHLDLLFEFFVSLRNEETLILEDLPPELCAVSHLSYHALQSGGMSTAINALYCRFLLSSREINELAQRDDAAYRCMEEAARVGTNLMKIAYDKENKLFHDYVKDGEKSEGCGAFTNFIAMYSGLAEFEYFEDLFYRFFHYNPPFSKSPEETENPYFSMFFLMTMFNLGQTDWAIRYIKDFWGRRIDESSGNWKDIYTIGDMEYSSTGSHIISPNSLLISEVAGLREAEPRFEAIYFNPAITSVKSCKLLFHAVPGKITIDWEMQDDGSFNVRIDSSFALKVAPQIPMEVLDNSTFELGEHVTLLEPGSIEYIDQRELK